MKILGIETSCDETSASVVTSEREILSNIIVSQLSEHEKFGGVVPEVAARAHLHYLPNVINKALCDANVDLDDIDAIAVTAGPGLIGGVMVGTMAAKAICLAKNKKLLCVNHLMGHALAPRLSHDIEFPYLLLLISGGHSQLLLVKSAMDYELLGTTIDDAAGECFDKSAKSMGIPHPGGPNLEKIASVGGDETRYKLPRPLCENHSLRSSCDFSFSGLKTAIRSVVEREFDESDLISDSQKKKDLAASFQKTMAEILAIKTENAIKAINEQNHPISSLVVSGGVAANSRVRKSLLNLARKYNLELIAPPAELCTDNAAMIAWAGVEKLKLGLVDDLDFAPKPRWPLTDLN